MASRHKSRILALQGLYQFELTSTPLEEILSYKWFNKEIEEDEKELSTKIIKGVVKNWDVLDTIIRTYSTKRSLDQISIVNRCILRLSIFSLINMKEISGRIVINEAIELAREFESEESTSFINGILDSIYREEITKNSGET